MQKEYDLPKSHAQDKFELFLGLPCIGGDRHDIDSYLVSRLVATTIASIAKCVVMTQRSNKLGIGLFERLCEDFKEASTDNNNDKHECSER